MFKTTGVALVTGASQGIGLVCARRLLREGWKVVFAARNAMKLAMAVSDSKAGGMAIGMTCDVTKPESVANMFRKINENYGRLDLVFNNAGSFGAMSEPGELSFESWREIMAVNLDGAFLVASAAFEMMKQQTPQGGRIINNGSLAAETPRPGSIAYTASKHAITGLTKSLALDGRAHDITASQIDIGNAATEMTHLIALGARQPDGSILPEPVIDPMHVADAVAYIASLPLNVTVLSMNVMATKMPFVGRG